MRAIASIGLIVAAGASATIASRPASCETTSESAELRRVVLPTASDAGGALELSSFGVAELATDDGSVFPALHVRAVIASAASTRSWAVDASKARLEALPGTVVEPVAVNADLTTLPIAIIDPGERRVIDLYFPLPPELARRGGPASFALSWPVHIPERTVRHAWFARGAAVVRLDVDAGHAAGRGAQWWFDPGYPWIGFHHRRGIAVRRAPERALVIRAPRWEVPPAAAHDRQPPETECEVW